MTKLSTMTALALALATTSAHAITIDVVSVGTSFADNSGIVNGPGYGAPWTMPILLTTSGGQTIATYCDDLFHNIYVEGGQDLQFTLAPVTTNGIGGEISEATSNVLGQLAGIGLRAATDGNEDLSIAAQAAIWELEYGGPVTSPDGTVQSDIVELLATTHNDGEGYAEGLISASGAQGQILASLAVPETRTWLMVLVGFAGLGVAASRCRAVRVSL